MPDVRVDVYCEDEAHELFVRAMVRRVAVETGVDAACRLVSARHGSRVYEAVDAAVKMLRKSGAGNLAIVMVDGNCSGWNSRRQELEARYADLQAAGLIAAAPDPHIERWFFADPRAFTSVTGGLPPADAGKCDRDLYKRLFTSAVEQSGVFYAASPYDLVPDIVEHMDLFRASKNQPSLKHLIDSLRAAFKVRKPAGS